MSSLEIKAGTVNRESYRPSWSTQILPETEERPTVSVVVPALNEAKNLPHVLPKIPTWVDEIILVDGNSTDNTVEVACQLCPDINVVMQQGKGKGNALRAGFAAATGDIIVMIDADGSTKPEEIPAYVGALLAGADYVKGSRFLQGGGSADLTIFRTLGNLGFTMLVRALFGGMFSDLCYGYNAFWKSVVEQLDLDADGFEIETLMNLRALRSGLKISEVPSFEELRIHGESHLNPFRDGLRVLRTVVREYTGGTNRALTGSSQDFSAQNLGSNSDISSERPA